MRIFVILRFVCHLQGRLKGLVISLGPIQIKEKLFCHIPRERRLKLCGGECQSLQNKLPWGSYCSFLHKGQGYLLSRIFERSNKYWFLLLPMKDKQLQQFPSHRKQLENWTKYNNFHSCFSDVGHRQLKLVIPENRKINKASPETASPYCLESVLGHSTKSSKPK